MLIVRTPYTLDCVMWNDSSFILSGDSYITLLETDTDNFFLYITITIAIVITAMLSMIVIIDNTITAAERDALLEVFKVDRDGVEGNKFKVFEVWLLVVSVTQVS